MAKKLKRERGYYRELKNEMKAAYQRSLKKPKIIEFWLKHSSDLLKDVHFYVNWNDNTQVLEAWDYISKVKDGDFEENVSIRILDAPTTRAQKAILKSHMHGIPHLIELS
ncbi:hypothetical protein [Paenibacillus sinopodophylli]|uniref:hypothetical protein n=1 Tax=Paenibacillus sinopodophylli TaxID=1837342 RepID=UPI00110D0A42|nr:hypothetical protein [Paenibacillus sinopodophylli]